MTDPHRTKSMMYVLRQIRAPHSPGASLFFFATRDELRETNPLSHVWRNGEGHDARLI